MLKKRILYISLTGMTESLGRSQVLEYITELSKQNQIHLVSFERESDLSQVDEIKKLTSENNIKWSYLIYSNKYGIFSSVYQIINTIIKCSKIIKAEKIEIIHARAMIPAVIALFLKKIYKVKFLFDIRGFAIDEKIDSNRLNKNSLLFKILKKLDNYLYKSADHIVTLTQSAKNILVNSLNIIEQKITIIPTCANKEIFKIMDESSKKDFKEKLGFKESDKILIHTGTVLNRYDFEKEVLLFKKLNSINPNYKFLIVNKGEHEYINIIFKKQNIEEKNYLVTSSSFTEVYKYLNISDYSIFFIPPTFAKNAMAPTKFAENVACELPSITNKGVGDMELYMTKYDVGQIIDLLDFEKNLDLIIEKITSTDNIKNLENYTSLFENHFNKKIAINKYQKIYESI